VLLQTHTLPWLVSRKSQGSWFSESPATGIYVCIFLGCSGRHEFIISRSPAQIAMTAKRKQIQSVFIFAIQPRDNATRSKACPQLSSKRETLCFRMIKQPNFAQLDVYVFERHLTRAQLLI